MLTIISTGHLSLRLLYISSQLLDPYPTKLPPLLDTLVITVHRGIGSVLHFRGLLTHLPSTIKNLTIKVMVRFSE